MASFTVEIPDVVRFVRAGQEMAVDVTGWSAHIIGELAAHGIVQKIGDAAAGKVGDEARAAMLKVTDALAAGAWDGRGRGGGGAKAAVDPVEDIMVAEALILAKSQGAGTVKRAMAHKVWYRFIDVSGDKPAWDRAKLVAWCDETERTYAWRANAEATLERRAAMARATMADAEALGM